MIKATKYIVVGRYESERNSWVPCGDIRHFVSGHRKESAAWRAAEIAHEDLGGCDGSDSLTDVLQQSVPLDCPEADEMMMLLDRAGVDYYEHAGYLYVACDFWRAHSVVPAAGGFGIAVNP